MCVSVCVCGVSMSVSGVCWSLSLSNELYLYMNHRQTVPVYEPHTETCITTDRLVDL